MPKNYVIGIGGTGARVVESIVQCCAAGFGPAELNVFLIDADDGNGNLNTTKTLVANYETCASHFKDRNSPAVRLFDTRIKTPANLVWSIFKDDSATLLKYIHYDNLRQNDRNLADFVQVLYSDDELKTNLNEGFRGHPSIGALAMSNVIEGEDPWKSFWDDVTASSQEHEVRVFLVGSIFGGTGAAGVPTFGAPDMLKFHPSATIDAANGKSKILLGGALVLPYFTIDMKDAPDAAGGNELFVTASDFPVATKAALHYYDEKALAFDQMYFIGDSLGQQVGAFSTGTKTQKNRPHYIELVTALAAFDFFRQSPPDTNDRMFFAASRKTPDVDWASLPVTRDAGRIETMRNELTLQMATMAVFAYAFATFGQEILAMSHEEIHDPWYRDHFKFNPKRPEDAPRNPRRYLETLQHVAKYCELYLAWIAAFDEKDGKVNLVDRSRLFEPRDESAASAKQPPPKLLNHADHPAAIGSILKTIPSEQHDFSEFRNELNALKLRDQSMSAVDKYVNLFYEAAYQFVVKNWRISLASTTR
jgi:hypothetical protein